MYGALSNPSLSLPFAESVSVRKRTRRVLDSDDEDEEVAIAATETGKTNDAKVTEQPATLVHGDEELSATTKKLKLDPATSNKSKAEAMASKAQKPSIRAESKRPQSLDDKSAAETEDKIEADDEVQEDDIEQQDEAVEIKQAAAKWYVAGMSMNWCCHW